MGIEKAEEIGESFRGLFEGTIDRDREWSYGQSFHGHEYRALQNLDRKSVV
jgi:hypothetical protein